MIGNRIERLLHVREVVKPFQSITVGVEGEWLLSSSVMKDFENFEYSVFLYLAVG